MLHNNTTSENHDLEVHQILFAITVCFTWQKLFVLTALQQFYLFGCSTNQRRATLALRYIFRTSCNFQRMKQLSVTDFLKDSQKTPRSKRKAIHIPLKKKTKDCRPTFRIKRLVNITCSSRQNFVANWHASENTKKGFTWPSCKRVTL